MLSAHAEFTRRVVEIDEYVAHLESLELSTGFPVSLMNTMKSSALLMIYNVVESTMTNLLQDVFDHLHTRNVSFDSLNNKMKTLVLSYSKRRNSATLVEKMGVSAMNLVVACFERTDVFSGNLDCRKIRDTLKEVGVSSQHSYSEKALAIIKAERNDLAHGTKSFSDCGKNYSAKQLRELHGKSKIILERVIDDFERFLTAGDYT
jgi:hypothetical protein